MTARSKTLFFVLFLTAIALIGFAMNAPQPQAQGEAVTRDAVGPLVREYLLANPEVVIEAVELYQKKQEEAEIARQKEGIKTHSNFLYDTNQDTHPWVGNPDADITIVEFFDYNCGYCKRAFKEVQSILESDKNIRVVFKEMPILSPASYLAAQWALAAHRQGKYFEYHQRLMSGPMAYNEETLAKVGEELGLDVEKLKKDAADPKTAQLIAENLRITRDLGIRGTPAFVINDRLIGGYIELAEMERLIADIRAQEKRN